MHARKRAQIEAGIHIMDGAPVVEITPLGAGQEVGRSCIYVKYM